MVGLSEWGSDVVVHVFEAHIGPHGVLVVHDGMDDVPS